MPNSIVALFLLGITLLPSAAHAGAVVLSPLLGDDTVNDKQRFAVHQLLSSELDFAPEVSRVVELSTVPSGLNDWCLGNARCLGGIVASNEADEMLAGRLRATGNELQLTLVFFDGQSVARTHNYTIPSDPTGMANEITPVIREMLTGVNPREAEAAKPTTADFEVEDTLETDPEMDLDFDDAVAEAPPTRSIPTAPAPQPEPPPPPAPAASLDADAAAITFGSSVDDISVSELEAIQFADPGSVQAEPAAEQSTAATREVPRPQPVAQRRPIPEGMMDAPSGEDAENTGLVQSSSRRQDRQDRRASKPDKAAKPARTQRSTSSRVRTTRPTTDDSDPRTFQIAGRGGYSNYYTFDFITVGVEASARVVAGLNVIAGVEAYTVNRILPPDVALEQGVANRWDVIFPMNVGLIYDFDLGKAQPYVGADFIFVRYYNDPDPEFGADWAGGGRGRLGLNYMVLDQLGINVNLAAGAWWGANWGIIESGLQPSGFLPQISAGTVVRF
ncbi:MAG: hypothetical protein KTR31_32555 [Myxococcales bacterium]|nr:hypothetical protein [Myxococcales bacterium]